MSTTAGIITTYECSIEFSLAPPVYVGAGGFGNRAVGGIEGGTVTGSRITGKIVGPAADWLLVGDDGYARIDVRMQIATNDEAFIYLSYVGLLEMNERVMAAALDAESETSFDDQYFRTTPRMESGDERYEWVNQTIFVARGRLTKTGIAYEVYRV